MSTKIKKIDSGLTYPSFLEQLKVKINQAQLDASLAVSARLIQLYWEIGEAIDEKQEKEGWGSQIIERLCADLQHAFPGIQGFSRTNIFRMRSFYQAYANVPPRGDNLDTHQNAVLISKIPWSHNVLLVEKVKDSDERFWYVEQVIEHGLSKRALEDWIKSKAHKRHGKAITNFDKRLPAPQSQVAQEVLKDPYVFDFLTLASDYRETDLEQALIENIQKFLLELGKGFAFIGRQYHLEVDGDDYYLDLLFYHIKLRCFCVIELKNTDFKPEYAGKLNFYLSAVDDLLKQKDDHPSIGILLCKSKKKFTVEYALRDINKPIGVSDYLTKMLETLPKKLQSSLPTIEDIEASFMAAEIKQAKKIVKKAPAKKAARPKPKKKMGK